MSGDAEQEYFSDGISEDIITDLSKIAGLIVIARNSSFTYKGAVDARAVGRELEVRSVLEGSIRWPANACASPRSSSTRKAADTSGATVTTAI
jgi:adenylate cyclase